MKKLIILIAGTIFAVGCGKMPTYEFTSQDKHDGSNSEALIVDGIFKMKATQVENTCFPGGLALYPDLIPFVFTGDSEGEIVPGDAILLFEESPLVEEGITFGIHVPLRYDEEYGEWLGLIIWDPDDEVTMMQYSGDFSGENGIANYHEATIVLEYSPELCESGNLGRTVTRVEGWRAE